jgi:hypothetical protein
LAEVDIPKNRSWRAFQLAFILINLPALTSLHHPDRGTGSNAGAIRRLQNACGRDGENGVAVTPYSIGAMAFLSLHGAACHNCLFLPETSCERGNRYLDRTVLVPTMERADFAFFQP